jgi:hypothetical protein
LSAARPRAYGLMAVRVPVLSACSSIDRSIIHKHKACLLSRLVLRFATAIFALQQYQKCASVQKLTGKQVPTRHPTLPNVSHWMRIRYAAAS